MVQQQPAKKILQHRFDLKKNSPGYPNNLIVAETTNLQGKACTFGIKSMAAPHNTCFPVSLVLRSKLQKISTIYYIKPVGPIQIVYSLFVRQQQNGMNNLIQVHRASPRRIQSKCDAPVINKVAIQRLSEATESAENRYFTRERTESLAGSYGWSLDGISNIAGIGLL